MAVQDVSVTQRGGWCQLESCEEGAGALGDVAVFGDETWEVEVCDACLIRLSSATDPGEVEELEEKVVAAQKRIDELEAAAQEGSS